MRKPLTLLFACFLGIGIISAQEDGFLGIRSTHISKKKAQAKGINNAYGDYVTRIVEGTAAEKMGLQPFDQLIGINGVEATKDTDFSDLLDRTLANQSITIKLERNGEIIEQDVTLGERVHNDYTKEGSFLGVNQSHDEKPKGQNGALIGAIVKKSNAQMMQLQDGDIITGINEFDIYDWHDLSVAMDAVDEGENITVNFVRNGSELVTPTLIARTHSNTVHTPDEWNMPDMWEMEVAEMAEMPTEIFDAMDMEPIIVETEEINTNESSGAAEPAIINEAPSAIQNVMIERLTVFPNPTQGRFNISFFLPQTGNTNIRIFDQQGRQVYNRDLNTFEGLFQDQIDISNQAAGTYFLFIQQGDSVMNRKIVVAKP